MLEVLYKLLLSFNATLLVIVTFLINNRYYIVCLGEYPIFISYFIYLLYAVILTYLSLVSICFLSRDSIECEIIEVEQANNEFLPSYLGYFFVGLSVSNVETMFFIYSIIFIFTFVSQSLYFNPMFLCFGYHFYHIKTVNNVKQFIITKRKIRSPDKLVFESLRRINNFTYIDEEKE